jgi:hypothetical protein
MAKCLCLRLAFQAFSCKIFSDPFFDQNLLCSLSQDYKGAKTPKIFHSDSFGWIHACTPHARRSTTSQVLNPSDSAHSLQQQSSNLLLLRLTTETPSSSLRTSLAWLQQTLIHFWVNENKGLTIEPSSAHSLWMNSTALSAGIAWLK